MKQLLFLIVILLISCKSEIEPEKPKVKPSRDISFTEMSDKDWWIHYKTNYDLYKDFKGVSKTGKPIEKLIFLKRVLEKSVLPSTIDGKYQLIKVDSIEYKSKIELFRQDAKTALKYFNLEWDPIPEFEFKTINDELLNSNELKGKFVVLKTWFINCAPCVAEVPELNKFVKKYENENVVFISLALDEREKLIEFQNKKEWNYKVVANSREYIEDKLGLGSYPTHILINPKGNIVKNI